MYSKWALIWPFFLILTLHLIAILLFTRGFLLTRTELSIYSNCSDISQSPCSPPNLNTSFPSSPSCWTKPAVDRLVIIVFDALRFDFVAPSTFFDEKKPWMDKLQVLQKLASDEESSAMIFKAIADPPTTSLQRLKGLTTGGLPTFIDVGNSFGAPAIIEDNLLHQLVQNGKRVRMMGDDTWVQLFPDHFDTSFPFPSFNVKDLDTVDNGCIQHLFPSLYEDEWDVLIAHFLGVDHAGHIFGVDSTPMMDKLEEYNAILEKVMEALKNQSGPGGLHENTLLLVIGDHGQTLNGDHGGGSAEEVETSLFAMSLKNPPASLSPGLNSSGNVGLDGKNIRVSSIQQLDFAVTVAALLGVPFPFGSIGRVNPELYALSAGTWGRQQTGASNCNNQSNIEEWLQNYANVLCINSWQVKRYIDKYSASSVIGFSSEDLVHVESMYAQTQDNHSQRLMYFKLSEGEVHNGSCDTLLTDIQGQIEAYSNFLAGIAELARSKWTEFDLMMMGLGLGVLLFSLFIHLSVIKRTHKLCQICHPFVDSPRISLRFVSGLFMVALRGCSFLANSYILAEGRVASFLLGTTTIINLRHSIIGKKLPLEAIAFLLLDLILRFCTEPGLSKQTVASVLMNTIPLDMLGVKEGHPLWVVIPEIVPIISLVLLALMLCKSTAGNCSWRFLKYSFVSATIFCYFLVAMYWVLESNMMAMPFVLDGVGKSIIPRIVYIVGVGLVVLLTCCQLLEKTTSNFVENIFIKSVGMLSAWSSTIILILGRQGPLFTLASVIGGWCIVQLGGLSKQKIEEGNQVASTYDPFPVVQWSILAVCLFFWTGHWCAFDGLRYGAAFIGFDEFNLIRQAILLFIDTFGVSHILPILGLPLLAMFQYKESASKQEKNIFFVNLSQVLLIYGLITATTTTFTVVCVTIHRRHLMVWGLFAPKFVFDVVGLILTDVIICLSSLYYFDPSDMKQDQILEK